MKKMKFMLFMAALLSCGSAFADTETNADANGGGTKDEAIVGESYTVLGTYNAGNGSTQAGTMPNKGFKLRTNVDGKRWVFTVNKPYVVTSLIIDGIGNYAANDETLPAYVVTSVEVDGEAISGWSGGEFPGKGAGESGVLTIENIRATESIAIYVNSDNAAGNQVNATWTIEYEIGAVSEPSITLSPDTIHLIPGLTFQIESRVIPSTFDNFQWYTGDIGEYLMDGVRSNVVSVDEQGLVTTLAPGTEAVKLTWLDNPVTNEDTCVVIVTDFNPAEHAVLKKLDFTTMGDSYLEQGGIAGKIWNDANNQTNDAYFCATPGLEDMCFQAVIATENDTKGWKLVDGEGLNLTGAGRCAGIGGLKVGQYVEINYTGSTFAYRDRGMGELKNGQDISCVKEIINEEPGRAIFKVLPDEENQMLAENNGVIGFEIARGAYVRNIIVYDGEASADGIATVEQKAEKTGATYNLMGQKVNGKAKGLVIENGKKVMK